MGEVWQATDEMLGRPVAVKLLIAQDADPSAAARFRMEAQTSASLSHPHVVGVYDFGSWEHRFYLVMELVEGGSLAHETAGGARLTPQRVADIAAGAAAGLAAAHRQGVVHRDIKPGNLLLTPDGTVKLGDFGIARFLDDPAAGLTTTGQIVGTGLYLAPERALGKNAGPASDVYSLGCVLYQLLTGNPPFRADTATGLLYQHVDAAPVGRRAGSASSCLRRSRTICSACWPSGRRTGRRPRRSRTGSVRVPGRAAPNPSRSLCRRPLRRHQPPTSRPPRRSGPRPRPTSCRRPAGRRAAGRPGAAASWRRRDADRESSGPSPRPLCSSRPS